MTFDFQTWMRAVWISIMEPSASAKKLIAMNLPTNGLWMGLGLATVLNVLLLAALQVMSPVPVALEASTMSLTPFRYAMIIAVFLFVFVYGLHRIGRAFGGDGTLEGCLAVVVWFQAISLTLEAIQAVLVLVSPAIAGMFGLMSVGALIWAFVNFVNTLHDFKSLGRASGVVALAFVGTAICAGILLTMLGVVPTGGLT